MKIFTLLNILLTAAFLAIPGCKKAAQSASTPTKPAQLALDTSLTNDISHLPTGSLLWYGIEKDTTYFCNSYAYADTITDSFSIFTINSGSAIVIDSTKFLVDYSSHPYHDTIAIKSWDTSAKTITFCKNAPWCNCTLGYNTKVVYNYATHTITIQYYECNSNGTQCVLLSTL